MFDELLTFWASLHPDFATISHFGAPAARPLLGRALDLEERARRRRDAPINLILKLVLRIPNGHVRQGAFSGCCVERMEDEMRDKDKER